LRSMALHCFEYLKTYSFARQGSLGFELENGMRYFAAIHLRHNCAIHSGCHCLELDNRM